MTNGARRAGRASRAGRAGRTHGSYRANWPDHSLYYGRNFQNRRDFNDFRDFLDRLARDGGCARGDGPRRRLMVSATGRFLVSASMPLIMAI